MNKRKVEIFFLEKNRGTILVKGKIYKKNAKKNEYQKHEKHLYCGTFYHGKYSTKISKTQLISKGEKHALHLRIFLKLAN